MTEEQTSLTWDIMLLGDCLEVMQGLPNNSIDVVLTDPPYSSGTRKEGQKGVRKSMNRSLKATAEDDWFDNDSMTTNGFIWLMRSCALEWKRILKPGGHILSFIDWRMESHLAGAIESADLRQAGSLIWDKTYFGMGSAFRNQHERILHFSKGRGRAVSRHDVGNVLSFPPVRDGLHPTEKPVPLLRELLSVVARPNDIILDCFAGSGSTCEAAILQGCHFIAGENRADYVAIAQQRIARAQGQWIKPTKTRSKRPVHSGGLWDGIA